MREGFFILGVTILLLVVNNTYQINKVQKKLGV